jgi:paraquat-inducible protein B
VNLQTNRAAPPDHVFTLYPAHDRIHDDPDLENRFYVAVFKDSVRGLTRGAPVEYRGIKVGQVEDLSLEFKPDSLGGEVPVLFTLAPERFQPQGGPRAGGDEIMEKLVERGLRVQLKTGSLLTGSLFLDLTFHPRGPRRSLGRHGSYAEIPTLPPSMGSLAEKLTAFAGRLEKWPLEDMAAQLRATLKETQALATRLDQQTAPQAEATLKQAQATLAALEKTLRSDSPTQGDLHEALEAFTRAARSLKDLADTLERQPEALIRGKGSKP